MNLQEFEYVDTKVDSVKGDKIITKYLVPCYYLEIFFDHLDQKQITDFSRYTIESLRFLLKFSQNKNQEHLVKIKNQEAQFESFLSGLNKKEYEWYRFSSLGDKQCINDPFGASDASFTLCLYNQTSDKKISQLEKYRKALDTYKTDILPLGIKISWLKVCFPLNFFKDSDDFKKWILESPLFKSGSFMSGTAGYRISHYESNMNSQAQNRLAQILDEMPGFDFNLSIGNSMGRCLDDKKNEMVPVIKRINWLNFISNSAFRFCPNIQDIKRYIDECAVLNLNSGVCLQIGDRPSLSINPSWHQVAKILHNLKYRPCEKDFYYEPDDETAKKWLYFYNKEN